jgi:hypothetical protein
MSARVASAIAGLLMVACDGNHGGAPPAPVGPVLVVQQALATTDDITVAYVKRLPERDFVYGSSNATREGWPAEGEAVTWRAFIRNFGPARTGVQYRFHVDEVLVKTATVNLAADSSTPVELVRPWDFARHAIRVEIDSANAVAEQEEANNSLTVDSNAISVGLWVERSLYDHFRDHQRDLVGVGSTCWENWAQRQIRRANGMFAAARSDVAPDGAVDRWRIDKIVVVEDGALPLNGGIFPSNDPDITDVTVDLQWGFPSSLLSGTDYAVTNQPSDENAFYFQGALIHELGHARYLIDVYGFNVHANAAGTLRDRLPWLENEVNVVGTKYLPMHPGDTVYKSHVWGLMNGPYTFLDLHSTVALNLIAGRRATHGNRNDPANIGVFLNDLPAQNRVRFLDAVTGAPLVGADVRLYQAVRVGRYGKHFDVLPTLQRTADADGAVQLGANPFKSGPLQSDDGAVLALRIAHAGRVRYRFMEPADFNLEYWRGHTATGQYTMHVDFRDSAAADQRPTIATQLVASPATVTGNTTSLSVLGADDGGEAALTYTWSVVDSPPVLFTPNFSNAAKNTTATFTTGGLHKIHLIISDGGGLDVTAAVDVTVNPGATVTVEAEADAYVRDGAHADSKFGTTPTLVVKSQASAGNTRMIYLRFPLSTAPAAVSSAKLRLHGNRPTASGSIDSALAVSSTGWSEADITWNNRPLPGPAQGPGNVITTGTASYHVWDVTSFVKAQKAAGATAVTLAIKMDAATALGPDTFSAREAASNRPQLIVSGLAGTGGGGCGGAPTVATPAGATPNPAPGTTTALSVLGADDGGAAALTYTWSVTGTPPATVTFTPNGSNAARNSTATFTQPGSYALLASVADACGQTVTSPVTVTVTGGGGSTTTTLSPVADAHVRDGASAAANFGTLATLEQKHSTTAGNHRRTFLRFPLDGVGGNVSAARLRLFGSSVTTAKLVGVYAVSDVSWGETSVTWNNAPAIGSKQGASHSVGTSAATVEWDVTAYVQAQKAAGATAVSLELKQDVANNETPTTFNARTATTSPPALVVTTSP